MKGIGADRNPLTGFTSEEEENILQPDQLGEFLAQMLARAKSSGTPAISNVSGYSLTDAAIANTPSQSIHFTGDCMKFERLQGRCFCCQNVTEYDPLDRFCRSDTCTVPPPFRGRDRDIYVTILPEWKGSCDLTALPGFVHDLDFFARAPEDESFGQVAAVASTSDRIARAWEQLWDSNPIRKILISPSSATQLLPFSGDHLGSLGLTLGNAAIFRLPQLEEEGNFRRVYTLDLAPYRWSHTLKDPRSWAIMNVALENDLRHLALYTAGNAGLSLARIAYEVNRRRRFDERIHLYMLVDDTVSEDIQTVLRSLDCYVLPIAPGDKNYILEPAAIWRKVNASAFGRTTDAPLPKAWHVTDGWDGVGVIMYRLLAAQVLRSIAVDYLLVPVGTGNLFLGMYMGRNDVGRTRTTKLIGVVPSGENVLENIKRQTVPTDETLAARVSAEDPPVAPKLVGRYTPLAPCLSHLLHKNVEFLEVSKTLQSHAVSLLMAHRHTPTVASEPSAILPFAALKQLNDLARTHEGSSGKGTYRQFKSQSTVLVVNSGFGILGQPESEFLSSFIPRGSLR